MISGTKNICLTVPTNFQVRRVRRNTVSWVQQGFIKRIKDDLDPGIWKKIPTVTSVNCQGSGFSETNMVPYRTLLPEGPILGSATHTHTGGAHLVL